MILYIFYILALTLTPAVFATDHCDDLLDVRDLDVNNRTQDSLTITWHIEGECADNITVCWGIQGRDYMINCSNIAEISVNTYIVEELEACKWYNISLSVTNSNGTKSKTVIGFTDGENTEAPQAAEDMGIREDYDTSLKVTWNNPTNGTCASHSFICWTSLDDGSEQCRLEENLRQRRSERFRYLKACTTYNFSVSLLSIDRLASEKIEKQITTGPRDIRGFSATTLGKDSIALSWEKSADDDCVSGYTLEYSSDFGLGDPMNLTNNNTDTVITGLEPCQMYIFNLVAFNDEYLLSNATAVTKLTSPVEPGKVENLTILHTASHSIHIQWLPPRNRTKCLQKYSVCVNEIGGDTTACQTDKASYYQKYSIMGLSSCTEHFIEVSALGPLNNKGEVLSIKQYTGPERVKQLQVTEISPTSANITWEASNCANEYSVCWGSWDAQGHNTCDFTSDTSYTVDSLDPSSNYTFIVEAIGHQDAYSDISSTVLRLPYCNKQFSSKH